MGLLGADPKELLLYLIPAALLSLTVHEFSHGLVSYWLGDPTPKAEKRLTLNPLRHMDFLGIVCLVFMGFGWAKPVRVNPNYYRNNKLGMVLTALAGPASNALLSLVCIFTQTAMIRFTPSPPGPSDLLIYIYVLLDYTAIISMGLGIFNLIPIPPLDGSKLLLALLPEKAYWTALKYEGFGAILLLALLWMDVLTHPMILARMWILGHILDFARMLFGV